MKDLCTIIVNRDRPDLTDKLHEQISNMMQVGKVSGDIITVEMGSDQKKLSKNWTVWYEDKDFRGKCFGHNVGLYVVSGPMGLYNYSKVSEVGLVYRTKLPSDPKYRYFLFLMNDIVFNDKYALKMMINIMDYATDVAILSPTQQDVRYTGCKPIPESVIHHVVTCDYLALMIRCGTMMRAGFLNLDFKYCWGAIHEYAYQLWRCKSSNPADHIPAYIAYCDLVTMKHLGGTTYGKVKSTISRRDYWNRASEFALDYFSKKYGSDWDRVFTEVLPDDLKDTKVNTFIIHRKKWENERM